MAAQINVFKIPSKAMRLRKYKDKAPKEHAGAKVKSPLIPAYSPLALSATL